MKDQNLKADEIKNILDRVTESGKPMSLGINYSGSGEGFSFFITKMKIENESDIPTTAK